MQEISVRRFDKRDDFQYIYEEFKGVHLILSSGQMFSEWDVRKMSLATPSRMGK